MMCFVDEHVGIINVFLWTGCAKKLTSIFTPACGKSICPTEGAKAANQGLKNLSELQLPE